MKYSFEINSRKCVDSDIKKKLRNSSNEHDRYKYLKQAIYEADVYNTCRYETCNKGHWNISLVSLYKNYVYNFFGYISNIFSNYKGRCNLIM